MNQNYIIADNWKIIEEGFDVSRVESSESIFSIGNGAMGQRANFEEDYSGQTLQGSYIGGVYYPDKTKVGWWKNGYPEYFAKVLNAPNWIGIQIRIENEILDLNNCPRITDFRRELDMKNGILKRSFTAIMKNKIEILVSSTRFLSMDDDEIGAIKYEITPLNQNARISCIPFLDGGIKNKDSNWDEKFWKINNLSSLNQSAFLEAETYKTKFKICSYMNNDFFIDEKKQNLAYKEIKDDCKIAHHYHFNIQKKSTLKIIKIGGYISKIRNTKKTVEIAKKKISISSKLGFEGLLKLQINAWSKIWDISDIKIDGDIKAQQAIRFNIFQLNQTYSGKHADLNIGPKGFTGEKYGGSTYWDTEAYCLPFYLATKPKSVAKNLLQYRYNHLQKAIDNAIKLGFENGAALYPMVTMNGEECHNEWEITFEEIHRNGAIAYAIYNYQKYTGDKSYLKEKGIFVLIAISKFWLQRFNFSEQKKKYVLLGVTGPNEYENNINNNFYTNYIAKWCIEYTLQTLNSIKNNDQKDYKKIIDKSALTKSELEKLHSMKDLIYLPFSKKHNVYLQQDDFLEKDIYPTSKIDKKDLPINQNWSWDRILRSPFIKQADTLQTFYFFEDHFSKKELKLHYDFYEPLTVHESSLSPCIHSVLAASLGKVDDAYKFYLRTSRLDLDDYNKEVKEGLHITSMAGTWISIVEGFAGMRVKENNLFFTPKIPKKWKSYTFNILFREQILRVSISQSSTTFQVDGKNSMDLYVNNKEYVIKPNLELKIANILV